MRALVAAAAMTVTPVSKEIVKRRRRTPSPVVFDAMDDFLRAIETALGAPVRQDEKPASDRLDWSPESLSVRR